ncbi:hypothetical protein predicted by Glimmer/Critica [Sorangium cellulosum So ce56]|uniref:Uncharacterized protein n=1 Tax=Sorangium cellulosum (strain So ce56) TaxID=448385 RepID=A9G7D0_SORC5|nr:SIR2 family protein [Sorangium cellulosum]CAN95840.1 hypothetical protein predicted by Glimmer/Critica [Sorangium cellulosum So ce56]
MPSTQKMIEAFERLVGRVLDGRVVPFLGAGISQGARIPGDRTLEPSVRWLQERLEGELHRILHGRPDDSPAEQPAQRTASLVEQLNAVLWPQVRQHHEGNCPRPRPAPPPPKLDHAADVLTWISGATRLCDVLRIQDFTQLAPLPAHRFLAYLVREGLVTEIITTNYDTCIEQAFRESFGPTDDAKSAARAEQALAVVFNLAQYRLHAGRARTVHGDPVLHLYKINGDAADYKAALDEHQRHPDPARLERRAARIILTERQLQTFRDELWARDLYADRARSRSLLFSGFGSDDPQVRHHAMALMEEMQRQSQPVNDWQDLWSLPNAPFFSVYEQHLTFNQLQVLAGFAIAHVRPGTPPGGRSALEAACGNALLGHFGGVLDESQNNGKNGPRLPADLLFEKVFQAVWLRRLREELLPGRTLDTWLRSILREHRAWADWLLVHSGATKSAPKSLDSREKRAEARASLCGIAETLLARRDTTGGRALPSVMALCLMEWLYAVRTGGAPMAPSSDYYLPLREEPLLIPLTLLFCLWIASDDDEPGRIELDRVRPIPGIGLKLRIPGDSKAGRVERCVYLVKEGAFQEDVAAWPDPAPGIVWIIEIPGNDLLREDRPPVVAGQPLTVVRIERRTAAAVLRAARIPSAMPLEVLTQVFAYPLANEVP